LPPIEVYQIGDAYFVLDGNHRVSVARQLEATHIQAYVTEVRTKVPLAADTTPSELIVKSEYADFLARTKLDDLCPGSDLSVSAPGQYPALLEHIDVHRYFMGLDYKRAIPYQEAVVHWYREVYIPVVEVIREQGVLREFPGRTEADLYLWLSRRRADLQHQLEWDIGTEEAATELVEKSSPRLKHVLARVASKVSGWFVPSQLNSGPPPGDWRRDFAAVQRADTLFTHILVPLRSDEAGWLALEQAAEVARREKGVLRGLRVIGTEGERKSDEIVRLQTDFRRRIEKLEIVGELAVEVGRVAETTCRRARWTDLVVVSLMHPPAPQPLARLSSGFRSLVQRCPTPILAVRDKLSPLTNALVAYNGSVKANEALYVVTYLAARWGLQVVVLAVAEGSVSCAKTLSKAREYLEAHGVQASYVEGETPVAKAILRTAEEYRSNLIVMGGYGLSPLLEIVFGSTVDHVLLTAQIPVLICR
jgi:nucleotide-binding universal stress UspA family protein